MDKKNKELERENEILRSEKTDTTVTTDNEALEIENEILECKLKSLKTNTAEEQDEVILTEVQDEVTLEEVQDELTLEKLQDENNQLKREKGKLEEEHDRLKKENEALKDSRKDVNLELELELRKKNEELKRKNKSLKMNIQNIELKIKSKKLEQETKQLYKQIAKNTINEFNQNSFQLEEKIFEIKYELYMTVIKSDIEFNNRVNTNSTSINTYTEYKTQRNNARMQAFDNCYQKIFDLLTKNTIEAEAQQKQVAVCEIFDSILNINKLIDVLNRMHIQNNSEKKEKYNDNDLFNIVCTHFKIANIDQIDATQKEAMINAVKSVLFKGSYKFEAELRENQDNLSYNAFASARDQYLHTELLNVVTLQTTPPTEILEFKYMKELNSISDKLSALNTAP